MLVTIQFPIADARPFGSESNLRLPLPDWPEPETSINPQFVHNFGMAKERLRDPDEAWPDELKYVLARRALRFDRLEMQHVGLPGRRFRPKCAFRRLFCDGQSVVRAEVGLSHRDSIYSLKNFTLKEVLAIVREITGIPTAVPSLNGDTKYRPILAQGKNLARLYANSSMSNSSTNKKLALQLVEAADPIIIVELKPGEARLDLDAQLSEGLVVVDSACVNGAKALFCRLNTQVGIVSTWILEKGTATTDQLRSLRLCLTRLHAEREVLNMVLKQIHRKRLLNPPNEESVNLLDEYFNDKLKIINRETWGGMKQSEIVTAFDATQAVIRPASRDQLIKRYDGGRRQVWKKIEDFQSQRFATRQVNVINLNKGAIMVDKQVNVSGTGNIVNVAEYMSNVTNSVNNNIAKSDADDEVKQLIMQLKDEIELISNKVEPSQLKKMGKNLEALSNEIASEEPERSWYDVSLKGINEAAKAVGQLAEPILTIASKLSALLLV